jgi:hypothetical protein
MQQNQLISTDPDGGANPETFISKLLDQKNGTKTIKWLSI